MSLFDELLKSEEYKNLIEKLPKDERVEILKSLREFVEQFENTIIKPLENHKQK
jgi:hypothetical protein